MKKDLLKALSWRYATKTFDPEITLSKEQIDRIVEAFNLTATSFGLQPVKLFVVKDKGLKEQLTEASWGQNQVRTASHVLVFCIKTEITPEYIRSEEHTSELQSRGHLVCRLLLEKKIRNVNEVIDAVNDGD